MQEKKDSKLIEKYIPGLKINDSITDGLWKTGQDRYVKISDITDLDYLQKILGTIRFREKKKANSVINPSLENLICLYYNVLKRCLELGVKPNMDYAPMDCAINEENVIEQLKQVLDICEKINKLEG